MPKAIKSRELIIKDRIINFVFLNYIAKKKKGSNNNKDIFHAIKTIRGGYKCTKALKRVKKNTRLHFLNNPGLLK
jgi:hypothetical protein